MSQSVDFRISIRGGKEQMFNELLSSNLMIIVYVENERQMTIRS